MMKFTLLAIYFLKIYQKSYIKHIYIWGHRVHFGHVTLHKPCLALEKCNLCETVVNRQLNRYWVNRYLSRISWQRIKFKGQLMKKVLEN